MSTNGTTKNLYQRLAVITKAVKVTATGKTAQGARTISIKDTEDALGDLMADHGVVSGFHWNAKPEVVGQEGKVSTWLADITVWMVNADVPEDRFEEHLYDVGTSPSAAVSFALKRFYRAVFHLADESDENRSVSGGRRDQQRRTEQADEPEPESHPDVPSNPEYAALLELGRTLPKKAYDGPTIDGWLRQHGHEKVKASLLHQHRGQCGEECEHVKAQPSLLPDTAEATA